MDEGGEMSSHELFDYWELNSADQTAILGEFKRTTSGYLISMIIFNWTNQEEREMDSFRIMPKASLKVVAPNSASQTTLKEQAKQLAKTLENIFQISSDSLPLEELENYHLNSRLNAWLEIRKGINSSNINGFESLGLNKTTTIDYLNLQALGIRDYQKILADLHKAKPLTIRDRIAYARRHKWIDSVGHGERTSEMTRFAE